jgi:hypothetical protein
VKQDPGKEDCGIGASERKVMQREGSSASCGREETTGKKPGKEGSGIGAGERKVTERERSSPPTVNEKRKK